MTEILILETSRPTTFINLLGCLEVLQDKIDLEFNESGIHTLFMDKSHAAMIQMDLPSNLFDKYTYYNGVITVNINEMLKTLGKIGKEDELSVYYDSESLKLRFILRGYKGLTRNKTIKTLELLNEECPKPKIFFKSKTRILLDPFRFAIEDLSKVSEHLKIRVDEGVFELSVNGNLGEESTLFLKGDDNVLENRVEDNMSIQATFTISNLVDVLKVFNKVSEVVTIELDNDMPLRIDVELSMGSLTFYLAPCIGV